MVIEGDNLTNKECLSYWSRRFKKHKEAKASARMTTIPQLDIPHILVDDGDNYDDDDGNGGGGGSGNQPISPTHLSANRTSFGQARPPSTPSKTATTTTTTTAPGQHERSSSSWQHPLNMPRSAASTPSPPLSPSNLGFEMREVSGRTSSSIGELHRRTGSVSPTQARDMLDDSVWMESIRRSTTSRRSDRGSYRYADQG